jgi:hypothetical protein
MFNGLAFIWERDTNRTRADVKLNTAEYGGIAMRRIDDSDCFKRGEDAATIVRAEILRQAESEQATLATGFADLLGDGGPADETADEMIQAIREWRDTPSNRSVD